MTTAPHMFVAVVPPQGAIDTIDKLPTRAQRGVRYTRREQWHITLKFLGSTNPNDAAQALAAMGTPEADVTMGPAVSLMGTRVLIIPASGLNDMAAEVAVAFEGVGERQPDRDFTGHLTLARLKGAPLRDPSTISVLGAPISIDFHVAEVVLFETSVTAEGTTQTAIAKKSLTS